MVLVNIAKKSKNKRELANDNINSLRSREQTSEVQQAIKAEESKSDYFNRKLEGIETFKKEFIVDDRQGGRGKGSFNPKVLDRWRVKSIDSDDYMVLSETEQSKSISNALEGNDNRILNVHKQYDELHEVLNRTKLGDLNNSRSKIIDKSTLVNHYLHDDFEWKKGDAAKGKFASVLGLGITAIAAVVVGGFKLTSNGNKINDNLNNDASRIIQLEEEIEKYKIFLNLKQ